MSVLPPREPAEGQEGHVVGVTVCGMCESKSCDCEILVMAMDTAQNDPCRVSGETTIVHLPTLMIVGRRHGRDESVCISRSECALYRERHEGAGLSTKQTQLRLRS